MLVDSVAMNNIWKFPKSFFLVALGYMCKIPFVIKVSFSIDHGWSKPGRMENNAENMEVTMAELDKLQLVGLAFAVNAIVVFWLGGTYIFSKKKKREACFPLFISPFCFNPSNGHQSHCSKLHISGKYRIWV